MTLDVSTKIIVVVLVFIITFFIYRILEVREFNYYLSVFLEDYKTRSSTEDLQELKRELHEGFFSNYPSFIHMFFSFKPLTLRSLFSESIIEKIKENNLQSK